MLSNLILLTCLNRYLLVLCYTIVTFSLNRLNDSTSQVASQRSKVVCCFFSVPELVDVLLTEGKKGPNHCLFVEAIHSKPTLFAAFLLFLAKNAMSASLLNAFS